MRSITSIRWRRVGSSDRESLDAGPLPDILIGVTTTVATRAPIRTEWPFYVNSIIAGTLGIVLARLIEQFGVAIGGWIFGRDPVIDQLGTTFQAEGSDLAYAGGTLAALAAAVFFLSIYPGSKDRSTGRLTLLWVTLHCFRIGLSDLALMPLTDTSAARALSELNIPAGLDIVLAATGAAGLILVALAAAPAFLGFSRHVSEVATSRDRIRFVAMLAVFPSLVSPLLAVPFFLPDPSGQVLSMLPFVGLFTIVTLAGAPGTRNILAPLEPGERRISWGLVAAAIFVLVVFQFGLQRGIPIPPWDEHLQLRL